MFNGAITIAACLGVLPLAFASWVTQNALADPVNGVADAAFVFTVTMFLASLLSALMFFFVQFSTLNLRLVKLDNASSVIFLGAASGLAIPLILQLGLVVVLISCSWGIIAALPFAMKYLGTRHTSTDGNFE